MADDQDRGQSSDSSDEESRQSNENTEESVYDSSAASADESTRREGGESPSTAPPAESSDGTSGNAEDDLPEWEPLTPELVEEEAWRGDVMLRWAVVLLAFLFGCTKISDTSALVHIKSGQYLLDNGILPPGEDVFSYTASGQPWVQLSWLFDIIVGLTYSTLGPVGVSMLGALLAAVVIGLAVNTVVPNVSTWWGSICAALAVLAACPLMTPTPELITLLGLALTLRLLQRWITSESPQFPWMLPVAFVVWANMDPGMFFGLFLLLLYAVGRSLNGVIGTKSGTDTIPIKQVWMLCGLCVAAALVNPFVWRSLTAPVTLYATEYPILRDYNPISMAEGPTTPYVLQHFPVFASEFLNWMDISAIAAFVLAVAALITFSLNSSRLDFGHVAVFLGFLAVGLITSRELGAAAIVAGVLASLNGQAWYRATFRQEYSVKFGELLFSRGGRAVCVLGFFVLALLGVSGRLSGNEGRTVGFGFDNNLTAAIDAFRKDLATVPDENQLFAMTLTQGDLLIWLDRPTFIDNRVAFYKQAGVDVVDSHFATRRSLVFPESVGIEPLWKSTFDEFEITYAIPRLFGARPDFRTARILTESADWDLEHVGGATNVYRRRPAGSEETGNSVERKLIEAAFRTPVAEPVQRLDWARELDFYETWFFQSRFHRSAPFLQMRSLFIHLHSYAAEPHVKVALALLTIRAANEALEALGAEVFSAPDDAGAAQIKATAVEAEKALKKARTATAARQADAFLAGLVEGGAVGSNLVESLEGSPALLQELLNGLKKFQFSQAAFLVVDDGEKLHLGALCGADGNKAGHGAGNLIKNLAPIVGGKGGGKPDMARGAGTDRQQKDELLEAARAKLL